MNMTFEKFLLVLRARWRLILSVMGCVVFLVLVLSLIWPKQYKASASVVIDAKVDPVAGAIGGAYSGALLASYVTTQGAIIASERVAQRVVKSLQLDQDPQLRRRWLSSTGGQGDMSIWLADEIVDRKLTVLTGDDTTGKMSNVIEISVKWSDAKTAAALANAFAQTAIDTNIELKVEPAKQYTQWFEKRLAAMRRDLALKQKRLSDFQNASGIVATDEKLDVENARLAELSTQLVNIQTQRQESQSHQRQTSGDNASLPEVLQSPVIGSLKKALADAEAKQQEVASLLGKNHPDYQAAQATVDGLHARINQEIGRIAASLTSTSQIDVRRENDVRAALEQQKKRVMELKHQHDDAAVLEDDVTAAQRDLDAVSQRLAQSNLESQTQQTNIVQLTVAAVPLKPYLPKIPLNLLLAIFVGAGFGVVVALRAEQKDGRVRSSSELTETLGLPVLGSIPLTKLRKKDLRALPPPAQLNPSAI